MALLSTLTLLSYCAALATAAPASTRGTESGGGIAPWAGQHPLPPPRPESREATFSATAAASQVPVGTIITRCTVPGTVALTFDDGPHPNTDEVLNHLRNANMRATFFVNGDNFNYILDQPGRDRINRMIREGHQIGSHTYVYFPLFILSLHSLAPLSPFTTQHLL
jgi:peptidoglycan/xylan/chitin deacetylase (PgdA/CDA1 family)